EAQAEDGRRTAGTGERELREQYPPAAAPVQRHCRLRLRERREGGRAFHGGIEERVVQHASDAPAAMRRDHGELDELEVVVEPLFARIGIEFRRDLAVPPRVRAAMVAVGE